MKYIILTLLGLAIANFAWQFFDGQQWSVAAERTFFQLVAGFAIWMTNHDARRN